VGGQGCAELVLNGPRVAVVKRRLLLQAQRLGHAMTNDPGLHVLAHGRVLALDQFGNCFRALLPNGTAEVRIRSRTWVPAHMSPDEEDCRPLGIAISRHWLDRREVALDSPALSNGWHAVEPEWLWTDGNSHLGLAGVRELAFEIKMVGRYWLPRRRPAIAQAK
jgi:hypothetical protein